MNKTYFISDWHFCHNRDFLYQPRGFDNVQKMNEFIIQQHNSIVDKDDTVFILGDCMLNDDATGVQCINKLNGILHLIRGNHDTDSRIKTYLRNTKILDVQNAMFFNYGKYKFYLSHYPTLCSNNDENKHLSQRMINICGHTHTKNKFEDRDKGLIYHVECDANNCTPVEVETIISDLKKTLN